LVTCIKPQPEPEYGLEVDIASEAVFPPVTYMLQPEVLESKLPFERIVPGTDNPKIGDAAKRIPSIINASRTVLTLIFMFYFSLEAFTLMDMEEAPSNQCAFNFKEKHERT